MHCNLRPPEPRQSFPTPCQVWSRWTYPLLYYSVLLLIHYFTLWPWPLTFDLEHVQCIACDMVKLCTKFERNRAIRGGVIAISVFDLMTLNAVCIALGSEIIFTQVWPSTTYPCLNYSVFFDAGTLCHAVTLTFDRGGALLPNGSQGCVNPNSPKLAQP